jgi:hypothetical protein
MRIADEFLRCIVYIYPDEGSAAEGKWAGGSGFLVHSAWSDGHRMLDDNFVVTNRHVIHEMGEPFIRVNRRDGGIAVIRTNRNRWRHHPDNDDVSALRFDALSEEHDLLGLNESAFVDSLVISNYNLGIGDDVAMVGRLVEHDGRLRNLPTARFGTLAMMPGEQFKNRFDHEQESFLVDCQSMPGFSGSPVLLLFPSSARSSQALLTSMVWLLGIDWMHVNEKEPIRTPDGEKSKDGLFVKANSGVAGVIPAWRIRQLLDTWKVREDR